MVYVVQIGLDITVHGETVVDDGLHVVKFPRHRSVFPASFLNMHNCSNWI